MNFGLTSIVNVSVATPQLGVAAQNVSNIALFTRETPVNSAFGNLPYNIYTGAQGIIRDFGTGSRTAGCGSAIFAQQPSIRSGGNGGGYVVVIPYLTMFETLDAAITRMQGTVQFFGVLAAEKTTQAAMLSAAAIIQGQPMFAVFPSGENVDVQPGGQLDLLRSGGYTQSQGVLYDDGIDQDAVNFAAAYMSRLMSCDFTGSKTAQTMHLKGLATIQPDTSLTTNDQQAALTAGVDVYPSFGAGGVGGSSVGKVWMSTANGGKVDDRYASVAFANDLQVAYFNALATTNTKIPQTDQGSAVIKKALRSVCQQYVRNGWLAPGTWNGDVFGVEADLLRNVSEVGFYIYIPPIAQQPLTSIQAGIAPLVQIAVKMAGATLYGNVLVNLN